MVAAKKSPAIKPSIPAPAKKTPTIKPAIPNTSKTTVKKPADASAGSGGIHGYIAGGYVVAAPSKAALMGAIQKAENKIGNGTGYYFPGSDLGYPVTSSNPNVRAAIAQAMCSNDPGWCVQKPAACTSLWCQATQALGALFMAGAVSDGADATPGRDLIDGQTQVHIIFGDSTGGGHKFPGQPKKHSSRYLGTQIRF